MSDAVQRNRGQDTVARLNYAKPGLTASACTSGCFD